MVNGHAHHAHGQGTATRPLAVTLGLITCYMAAELVGGWWTGSLALLADAGHMLADAGALALSLAASMVAARHLARTTPGDCGAAASDAGHHPAELWAALFNSLTTVSIAAGIIVSAIRRFEDPQPVLGGPMLAIAAGGLAINLAALALLGSCRAENLNLRGAWLHVLGDTLGSVAAIVTGALIWLLGWHWTDPVASVAICLLLVITAWPIVRASVSELRRPHSCRTAEGAREKCAAEHAD